MCSPALPGLTPPTASSLNGFLVVPPDTHAAVGPAHVVEVVNSVVAFFNKATGERFSTQSLSDFFAPVGGLDPFDPVVAYDELAGRFIVGALDVDFIARTAHLIYVVSNTSNPLDGFTEMHRIDVREDGRLILQAGGVRASPSVGDRGAWGKPQMFGEANEARRELRRFLRARGLYGTRTMSPS